MCPISYDEQKTNKQTNNEAIMGKISLKKQNKTKHMIKYLTTCLALYKTNHNCE